MAVRNFNGTNEELRFAGSAIENLTGAYTAAVLVKLNTTGIYQCFMAAHTSANVLRWEFAVSSGNLLTLYVSNGSAAITFSSTTTWNIVAVTKTSGTTTPRFHLKDIATGAWTHSDGGATCTNASAGGSGGFIDIGEAADTDDLNARVALAGLWTTALSDVQVEALVTNKNTSDWTGHAVAPTAVWQLNQAAVTTSVNDLTANAVNQSARNGTSVVTGDDPSGWTFASSGNTWDKAGLGIVGP